MTTARRELKDPHHAASFHCVARCVRRAWLCGFDSYLSKSFEHRKSWVVDRIREVGSIFACGIYSYAVMSNHLHLVVHMSPATHAQPNVRGTVAGRGSLSELLIDQLSRDPTEGVRLQVVYSHFKRLSPAQLRQLSQDLSPIVRIETLRSEAAIRATLARRLEDPLLLATLAKDLHARVRVEVAANLFTPDPVLAELAKNPDPDIIQALSRNQ